MERKPVLGMLLGDGSGVGPEIIAKLAADRWFDDKCHPVFIGDKRILDRAFGIVGKSTEITCIEKLDGVQFTDDTYYMLDSKDLDPKDAPLGELSVECGKSNLAQLFTAANLFKAGLIEGFCFGPFNKAGLKDAGCKYESEHHLLAAEFNHTAPFGEINVVGDLWTTRTTSHIPISQVSKDLSVERILRAMTLANTSLLDTGLENPRIACAALNPHCGEGGRCGREEIDIITPAIEEGRRRGINVSGPYPSDITFIKAFRGEFDCVVTMYHDQGQIALKLKGFDEGITVAGGLPCPIVTGAHGTAYDIAGKGIVKTSAFENAVKMCAKMANHKASKKA